MSQPGILINSVVVSSASGGPMLLKAGTTVTDPALIAAVLAAGGILGSLSDPLLVSAAAIVSKMRASRGQDEWVINSVMGAAYGAASAQGSTPGVPADKVVNVATQAALAANTYSKTNQTLTANANGALTIDGVAVAVGMRVLVACEATASNNGIYVVTAAGAANAPYVLTRAIDASLSAHFQPGLLISVLAGTVAKNWQFECTVATPFTLDTTALTFFPSLQFGVSTLVAGVSPAIPAWITATSKPIVTRAALNATPALGLLGCDGGGDLVVGAPGSFVVRSRTVTATAATTDVSSFNWLVLTD